MRVLFLPHNAYHAHTMALVVPPLREAGARAAFVDIDRVYHDEGAGAAIRAHGLPCVDFHPRVLRRLAPDVLVVMNDWGGVVRDCVVEANRLGIATAGLVEGVQDFEDTHVAHINVGRLRRPYRTVKHPLLVGDYDRKFIRTPLARVVGLPRIEPLLVEPPRFPPRPLAAINSNFTYGIYTHVQHQWLAEAVEACRQAGVDYVITQHHADKAELGGYRVTRERIHDVLRGCSLLISRFSTCLLESMALGKPVIYHNPHDERVDCFQDPRGAYPITRDVPSLAAAVRDAAAARGDYRAVCRRFFGHHVSVRDVPSPRRIAEALVEIAPVHRRDPAHGLRGVLRGLLARRQVWPVQGRAPTRAA